MRTINPYDMRMLLEYLHEATKTDNLLIAQLNANFVRRFLLEKCLTDVGVDEMSPA